MQRVNKNSLLVGAVMPGKGIPVHYEHDDDFAMTEFGNGKVKALHTPRNYLKRIHEAALHANHTDPKRYARDYRDVLEPVAQMTEDCWLHLNKWPWRPGSTPEVIANGADDYLEHEISLANKAAEKIAEGGPDVGDLIWPEFAFRLRAAAVKQGMNGYGFNDVGFSSEQRRFAADVIDLLQRGKRKQAARMLQDAFFDPPELEDGSRVPSDKPDDDYGKRKGRIPPMQIIELPLTVSIDHADTGWRIGRTGTRIIRSAVMRPVPSQYAFYRRLPVIPGGAILVDASGSMGDWDEVRKWCQLAPQATVAYYAGGSKKGWLWVYARDGYRADEIVRPPSGGNTVDGHAITWLLKQPGPRTMITDRGFCGSPDSDMQRMRLANLEREGKITVIDYSHSS